MGGLLSYGTGQNPAPAPPPPAATTPTSTNTTTPEATPYQVPAPGAENTSATGSTGTYSFDPQDPYTLGILRTQSFDEGTQDYQASQSAPITSNAGKEAFLQGDGQTIDSTGKLNISATGQQIMDGFMKSYGTNRAEFDGLRTALAQAGYYGSDTIGRVTGRAAGKWDVNAMKNALGDYNTYAHATTDPLSFTEWLANNNAIGGTAAQVTLTDPAYLAMYAQRAASNALGRSLTPNELQAFVTSFQSEEQQNQTASQTGAAKVTSSDARSEAIQFIQKNFGAQESQHSAQGYMNALLDLFLPNASQRPSINVDPTAVSY